MTTRRFTLLGLMAGVVCALMLIGAPSARAQLAADESVLLDPFDPVPEIQFRHYGGDECWDRCGSHCYDRCGRRCYRDCRTSRERRFDRDAARAERDHRQFREDDARFHYDAHQYEHDNRDWHERYDPNGHWDHDGHHDGFHGHDGDREIDGPDWYDDGFPPGAELRHDEHVQERREERHDGYREDHHDDHHDDRATIHHDDDRYDDYGR